MQKRHLIMVFFVLTGPFLPAQDKSVGIRIIQEESFSLNDYETTVKLEKDKFRVQVYLQNTGGVYLFAALHDSLFRLRETDTVPGFSRLPDKAMAEETFNKDKELLIHDDGWSYWFYDPELDWHRFNEKIIRIDSGGVVGTKTIKFAYFISRKESVKLKDLNSPLYLFFVAVKESDAGGYPVKELMRRKVKIEWKD